MKRITAWLILAIMLSLSVSAAESDGDDFYRKQYALSGAEELYGYLPEEAAEYVLENGIDPSNEGWVNRLSAENVFTHIWGFVKSGARAPLSVGAAVLAVILISAALGSFELKGGAAEAALYATAVSAAAVISVPMLGVINAGIKAMQGSAVFMTAFVPVFAVISASSGGVASYASMSALLLLAAQAVNYISSFAVMPLMGGYMGVSLAASVSPTVEKTGIADGIKKLSLWIMSFISTVFVGVLSIQTAVNSSADSLALRTAKFIVGSSVPVAGTALSEALTTVTASMGLLKASVGIYGVVAVSIIFLPLIAELLLWRIMLMLNSAVAELLSLPKLAGFLHCADTVISVLTGILLLTGAMFIISLTVIVTMGKA